MENLFIHLHLPKCAGRTLDRHFAAHLSPTQYWAPKRKRSPERYFGEMYNMGEVKDLSAVRLISSHYVARSLIELFPGRNIRKTVLLRDPVSFFVSYYNFRMMRYLSEGRKTYGFDLAMKGHPQDYLSHFILRRWLGIPWWKVLAMPVSEKFDLLNEELASFWYCGAYTDCDDLVGHISGDLGVPREVKRVNTVNQWAEKVDFQPLTKEQLPSQVKDRILEENKLDTLLWNNWKSAHFDAGRVEPEALPSDAGRGFLTSELKRPYYQIQKRRLRDSS